MPAFLIQYNRRSGFAEVQQYDTPSVAMRERFRLMRERLDSDIEIVSITARNLDEVKRTHSRYFRNERMTVPA